MLSKNETAKVVTTAFRKAYFNVTDWESFVENAMSNGNAIGLYEQLQGIYSSFGSFESDEERTKAWDIMKPVSEAMHALWDYCKDEILANDGIAWVETDSTRVLMKTLRFWYENQPFCVDIFLDTDEEQYEAWLYADGYGIKESMFGCSVHSHRFGQPTTETLESFTRMVMGNLYDYLPDYIEQHMS